MKEKRKAVRRALRYTAWIGTGPKRPLLGCRVSDISESGAKLDVQSADDLPDEFRLWLSGRGGIYRHCRAVWRTETQIGVQFDPTARNVKPRAAAARKAPGD